MSDINKEIEEAHFKFMKECNKNAGRIKKRARRKAMNEIKRELTPPQEEKE